MPGPFRYAVAVMLAVVLAVAGAFGIKLAFIPGFEAWALWPWIALALFVPVGAVLVWRGPDDSAPPERGLSPLSPGASCAETAGRGCSGRWR